MSVMNMYDAKATAALLPFAGLIEALEAALPAYRDGAILCPERQVMQAPGGGGVLLSMPCAGPDLLCHKLVTVYPDNPAQGLPAIHGQVTCGDARTGRLLFTLDGPVTTGRRTAAVTLVGIRRLLPHAPRRILVIGTGAQADAHVQALADTWPQAAVFVQGRSVARERAVAERTGLPVGCVSAGDDPGEVDVVILVTTSHVPLYDLPARAGRLIVGVGAFRPNMVEIGAATIGGSVLYVDDPVGAPVEAGDYIQAGVSWDRVHPLVDAIDGPPPPADRPVVFKSVGCAAWDLAACRVALRQMGAG
ncbi:ornithine cyclodeaminase [Gluconacetobacter johannae DSM 13595]|nr:ornithine cyclodeaminase [Gluconacetobacter johannae DSM 13595]